MHRIIFTILFSLLVSLFFVTCTNKPNRNALNFLVITNECSKIDLLLIKLIAEDFCKIKGYTPAITNKESTDSTDTAYYKNYDLVFNKTKLNMQSILLENTGPFLADRVYFIMNSDFSYTFKYPQSLQTLNTGALYRSAAHSYLVSNKLASDDKIKLYYDLINLTDAYNSGDVDIAVIDRNMYYENLLRLSGELLFFIDETNRYGYIHSNNRALLNQFNDYIADIAPFDSKYWLEYFRDNKPSFFYKTYTTERLEYFRKKMISNKKKR